MVKKTFMLEEDGAIYKFKLISPLLEDSLDSAQKTMLRETIAEKESISVRTLYRYESAWKKDGFYGLRNKHPNRKQSSKLPKNFNELLDEAIQLKREVPKRSVNQIIWILENENKVLPGKLKRSTLERHLYKAGFGVRHLKMYAESKESSSKRFCKAHRMQLIQADIKYGPVLKDAKGKKIKTYLSSAIDDHSRFILFSKFYDNMEEGIVEDTFHEAILRYGRFDKCYFDNGTQYISRQLNISLSRLGIRVQLAPIRSGKSKGKVEKFHQVVDQFIREVKLEKDKTLDELNRLWAIYLEEYYHKKPHDGIMEYYESYGASIDVADATPIKEFQRDSRALTYLDKEMVHEAFLHHEKRLVDRGACISFKGKKYETKPELIGFKVEIAYDPSHPEDITVSHPGIKPFHASPLLIKEYCEKDPYVPISVKMTDTEPHKPSRVLNILRDKSEKQEKELADTLSYVNYRKGGKKDV